ncbi:MAG: ABC transporter permease [Flavobacteriales bacterium]|nr:ABC transporter permease [Flavobacteriales bacterium]
MAKLMKNICFIFAFIMNIEYFIAKKLFAAKENNNSYTKPILRIAIFAVSLSVAVMLISLMIVNGFKNNISSKVIGFGSHIVITKFSNNQSYESEPISINQNFLSKISNDDYIKNINVFATKAGIIKTSEEIHGVVLKGVSDDYNWKFFKDNLVSGEVLHINDTIRSNDILVSNEIARLLKLNISDNLIMYFMQEPTRVRKFNIKGIYSTEMVDFDKLFIIGDIKHIQSLNLWQDTLIGGFEITINDFNKLDKATEKIYNEIPYDLNARSIKERIPQIFNWLDLQDVNAMVILILMFIVGVINMITVLLILIIERTQVIGILKALGATNWNIQKVFLFSTTNLIVKALFFGNLIALLFAFLQIKFSIISLDPETYYMNSIPISLDIIHLLLINFFTICLCYLILIIPSIIITKITPIKAIRFK